MRFIFLLCLLFTASASWAGPDQILSVKGRLRLLLWVEGIQDPMLSKTPPPRPRLPEELEKALRKF